MTEPRVIAFLSDYGLADEFVGVCKSVMLSLAPGVVVLDLVHDLPPHDVRAGALALVRAVQYLPEDSSDIPVTMDEQIQKAVDCYNAGATLLHVHVREANGKGSKRLSMFNEMLHRLREAVRLAPEYGDAHANLGAALTLTHVDESVRELEKAVELAPDSVKARFNLAVAYGASPNHGSAKEIEQLRKVIELAPTFHRAHLALGKALLKTGQIPDAVTSLQEAVRLDPKSGEANCFSRACIQFTLPRSVLISPLCAKKRNGWARSHVGNVFVL